MTIDRKLMIKYYKELKDLIMEHSSYIKKRIAIFPKKTTRKIQHLKFNELTIQVNGESFLLPDLIKKLKSIYKDLLLESKPHNYNSVLRNYKNEAKTSLNINNTYNKYENILNARFDNNKEKMQYWLVSYKAIESSLKAKNVNESTDILSDIYSLITEDTDIDYNRRDIIMDIMEMVKKEMNNKDNVNEITALYESCANGEISLEERENRIARLKSDSYAYETDSEYKTESTNLTPHEIYDNIVSKLYERCSNGEISVSERELYIEKAKELYLK